MSETENSSQSAVGRFMQEMDEGMRRQGNVVFALIFKEFKIKSRRASLNNMLWVVLEPGIQIAIMALFWYMLRVQEIGGVNIAIFLAVSMMPFAIIQRSIISIPRTMKSNESFYSFQQVKPIDSVIARFVLDWVLLLLGGAVLLFMLGWWFGFYIHSDKLLQLMAVFVVAGAMGFGFALTVATYSAIYEGINRTIQLCNRGLLLVSAVIHQAIQLPPDAQYYISWNPIAHLTEYARYYAFGLKMFPEASMGYALLVTVSALFIGFLSYYANRFRLLKK